jgi:hypothetical protein
LEDERAARASPASDNLERIEENRVMPRNDGPTPRLLLLAAPVLVLLPAAAAAETTSESIGPWSIEATYKDDKFDRCAISRTLDDAIVVTFVRTGEGMSLLLSSPNWKLETGKNYPVTVKLGPQKWNREVAAEASSVSMDVGDEKFVSGLRAANALDVVAAGATIHVPLDKSTVAFERLEQCVEKNEKALETNPFVAPARRP